MLRLLLFFGGFFGNLISQSVVGCLGMVSCLFSLSLQPFYFIIALAQFAGEGDAESAKTFKRAFVSSGIGILGFLKGFFRLFGALTLVTPIMRGSQAISEPLRITGIYAPYGCETWWQELVGLDSWKARNRTINSVQPAVCKTKPQASLVLEKPAVYKTKPHSSPVLEGLVCAYREATTSEKPQYWLARGSETRGPYQLSHILRGFREGKLKDSDRIASSNSDEWRDWGEFKKVALTMAGARKKHPKDILKSIAIRYPRFYEGRIKAVIG